MRKSQQAIRRAQQVQRHRAYAPKKPAVPQRLFMGRPAFDAAIDKRDIAKLVGSIEQPVILEIGCNDGDDTQEILDTIPNSWVCAFECDPRAIEEFRRRINDRRCFLIEKAVGALDGMITFHQSGGQTPRGTSRRLETKDWNKSGSIHRPTGHLEMSPWVTFDRQIHVPVTRLDTFLADNPNIRQVDFIWADVQGAEHDLIEGGRQLLKLTRYLYSEFYQTPMYDGQLSLEQLLALLGPEWELMATYENCNFLAINKGFSARS
jgi:FkbM family methyltransferase